MSCIQYWAIFCHKSNFIGLKLFVRLCSHMLLCDCVCVGGICVQSLIKSILAYTLISPLLKKRIEEMTYFFDFFFFWQDQLFQAVYFCRCLSSVFKKEAKNVCWLLGWYHPEIFLKMCFLKIRYLGEVGNLFHFCELKWSS